jgi:hypothetical protein
MGRDPFRHSCADRFGASLTGAADVTLAQDTETVDAAFRLVHDRYVARGYMEPDPSGWRLTSYNAVPATKMFVAQRERGVQGTLTVIRDSPMGLPMDELYGEEMACLREEGRRVAEVSALAAEPDLGKEGLAIVIRLIRQALLFSAEVVELDDLCIAVNPRHVGFYRRLFGFRLFGPLKRYARVNGAPAVGLRLDLGSVRRLVQLVHSGRGPDEFSRFLYGRTNYDRVMARLRADLPRAALTGEQLIHFFSKHDLWSRIEAALPTLIACRHRDQAPGDCPRSSAALRDGILAGLDRLTGAFPASAVSQAACRVCMRGMAVPVA